jgi:ATP-dependent DNA helicase RecQ
MDKPERLLEEAKLSESQALEGCAAFEEHGSERLKPVFEALSEKFSYEQLHLLRVFYLQG